MRLSLGELGRCRGQFRGSLAAGGTESAQAGKSRRDVDLKRMNAVKVHLLCNLSSLEL